MDKFIKIEEWRWVDGYENYEVSNLGRVRKRQILKPSCSNGYSYIGLSKDGISKRVLVHSLIAEAFHGPRPDGMDCCHIDGNRDNNAADNLRWDTRSNNIKDRWKHQKGREEEAAVVLQSIVDDKGLSRADAEAKIFSVISLLRLDKNT